MIQRAQARNIFFMFIEHKFTHTTIQNFSESVYFLKKMSNFKKLFLLLFHNDPS